LRLDELEVGRTPANVIGRPDGFDLAFIIDKGTSDGIALGQPVIDSFGYVVGTIVDVTGGSAIVVPIMASRNGVAVVVGVQVGNLVSQPGTNDMALDIFEAREPVIEGDEVRTSALSGVFPAGLPVGQVLRSAAPESASLATVVRPYVQPEHLQVVVVLAWPPTPVVATTTTSLPEETTTIPEEGTTAPDAGGE
jgi:rod shape-determining protein MreC